MPATSRSFFAAFRPAGGLPPVRSRPVKPWALILRLGRRSAWRASHATGARYDSLAPWVARSARPEPY